jgi:hypothetical protein
MPRRYPATTPRKTFKFVSTVSYYDWDVHVVADDSVIEYMVVDPDGRTVEFSENGYGTAGAAMLDGLLRCKVLAN